MEKNGRAGLLDLLKWIISAQTTKIEALQRYITGNYQRESLGSLEEPF
jgi:hypothetical protein